MEIERKDIDELLMSYVAEKNKVFATTILNILIKYNLISKEEIEILCDKYKARQLFDGTVEYPILLKYDDSKSIEDQINISGKNRYYDEKFNILGEEYLIFSEWYWEKSNFKKGNRYPFYLWAVNKIINTYKESELISQKADFLSGKYNFTINHSTNKFSLDNFTSPFSTRYITALLAKPFVIFTGNSGTGKTKIATDFAKWLEKKTDTGFTNHLTAPVGADWTDNSKILGYFNPLANNGTGEYVKTEIFTLIEAANDNPDIPFFLILDEMNLSHVERYFADFLSAMESGKPILLYKKPENCESTVPEKIYLPKNLFVTGTVNIDETTYMFSPKVLDRANVIEFKPEQDNVLSLLNKKSGNSDIVPDNNGMAEAFMNLANDVRTADYDFSDEKYKLLLESFKSLYDILEPSGFEFAYRTTKEIALYVSACQKLNSDFKLMDSIDEQLLQKILPKVHGNRKQIGNLLEKLETFCADKSLPLSLAKVQKMKVRLENYQYASFI